MGDLDRPCRHRVRDVASRDLRNNGCLDARCDRWALGADRARRRFGRSRCHDGDGLGLGNGHVRLLGRRLRRRCGLGGRSRLDDLSRSGCRHDRLDLDRVGDVAGRDRGGLEGRRRGLGGLGGLGLGGGLLGGLLDRLGLFGLLVAGQTVTHGTATDHVGVGLVERRRVALHRHAERARRDPSPRRSSSRAPWPARALSCSSPCVLSSYLSTSLSARSSSSSAAMLTGCRNALSKPRRFRAICKHCTAGLHNQAPRPGAVRLLTMRPSAPRATRTRAACGRRVRHPMQVRSG